MNLNTTTSVLMASYELVAIDASRLQMDLFTISNQGYATGSGGGLGSAEEQPSPIPQPPQCSGNGCVMRPGVQVGTSRGARADWREVR